MHYITEDWLMESGVLKTWQLPESHTAQNLADSLQNTFDEWGLVSKAVTSTTDNANSFISATYEAAGERTAEGGAA